MCLVLDDHVSLRVLCEKHLLLLLHGGSIAVILVFQRLQVAVSDHTQSLGVLREQGGQSLSSRLCARSLFGGKCVFLLGPAALSWTGNELVF